MNNDYSLEQLFAMAVYKSLSKSERDAATEYAGPGESFPLYANGDHLAAAWDLAGHSPDKEAIRAKVRAFAKRHGLEGRLPSTAKKALVALAFAVVGKAKNEDMRALMQMAWDGETAEGDSYGKRQLVGFAAEHNILHTLPDDAHGMLHEMGVRHSHEGMTQDDEGEAGTYSGPGHQHPVSKAFQSAQSTIQKSWVGNDGSTYIEGWISTEDRDLEKDIVPPEAFLSSMDDYFGVGAPVSSEHNTQALPVGHLQKAAIVRDGTVLKAASHPDDAADFEYFPGTGTGVWGRARITEATTGYAIKSGNVRGFSWIGLPARFTKLADGGRRFDEVAPWNETTVAAYPINQKAAIMAAKARPSGRQMENEMDLEKLISEALDKVLAQKAQPAPESVAKADVEQMVASAIESLKGEMQAMVSAAVEPVAKAFGEMSREGVGRKAVVSDPVDEFESDPVAFLAKKGEATEDAERAVATAIFKKVMGDGLLA